MTTATLELQSPHQPLTFLSVVAYARTVFELWCSRVRQRRHLSELSPELLRDVGLSADAAQAEAMKPFWRA